nr:hypothetical protein [Tanacetum cinerariifolium]
GGGGFGGVAGSSGGGARWRGSGSEGGYGGAQWRVTERQWWLMRWGSGGNGVAVGGEGDKVAATGVVMVTRVAAAVTAAAGGAWERVT